MGKDKKENGNGEILITSGIGLIGTAVTPTPDDITIISPLLQAGAGIILILIGLSR